MISVDDVSVAYDRTIVVSGVSLTAQPGQVVGLIGPNGSGKTTLLRTVYAALAPRTGLVHIDDTPVQSLAPRQLARRIGVVAQEGAAELPVTVAEMVLLGRSPHRSSLQGYALEDHQIAAAALRRVGARHLADRVFATLSGGEKQRVLVARTLAQQADHLLLDEPDQPPRHRLPARDPATRAHAGGHHPGRAARSQPRRPVLRPARPPQPGRGRVRGATRGSAETRGARARLPDQRPHPTRARLRAAAVRPARDRGRCRSPVRTW
ncbi:MAG: ABC transporter ATP-binding protein [Pseudonocardiaceae bacterium]